MPGWLIVLLVSIAAIVAFIIGRKVSYRRKLTERQFWAMTACAGVLITGGLMLGESWSWSISLILAGTYLAMFQLGVERKNWQWLRQEWRKFRQARKARS